MNNLQEWIDELTKYEAIIWLARHINIQQHSPNPIPQYIELILQQFNNQVRSCKITNKADATNIPFWSGRTLFESGLTEDQVTTEINKGFDVFDSLIEKVKAAALRGEINI